jgi:FkbM family methyltransferase
VVTSILRTPGRIFPIPGWFPVVVERLHPVVAGDLEAVEVVTHGVRVRLDLRDYIQRRIFYESHEPVQLAFLERFLRRGDIVLDVGAHIGIFSLVAASIVGEEGQVHAFEPVPSNFEALEENVRANGFANVTLNRAAVGAAPGELELGLPEVVPDSGPTSAMYTVGGTVRSVTAPVIALDSYVQERIGELPIRLLKLDVEGLEPAVLAGFERRLASAPPAAVLLEVSVELLDRHGFRPDEVVRRLVDAGYQLYRPSAFGKLRDLELDLPVSFVSERDRLDHPLGLRGWLRRYRNESRLFFNVVAVRPGAESRRGRSPSS